MPASTPLTIPLGRTCPIAWTYTSDGTTPVSLATVTDLIFTIAQGGQGSAQLLQKKLSTSGWTITNSANGQATILLSAADTSALAAGSYAYDVEVVFADGSKDFPSIGTVTLVDHPNR